MGYKLKQEMIDVIEELRSYSDNNTDGYLKVALPTLKRDFTYTRKTRFNDSHNLLNGQFSLQENTMLFTYDIPYTSYQHKNSYMGRLDDLFRRNLVYPFLLFVDGKFIKWSDIYIMKDCRYSYIILKDIFLLDEKVEMVTLPKDISYNEISLIDDETLFAFRDGKLYEGNKTCITIKNTGVHDYYYEQITLKKDVIQQFSLDPMYEMCADNIIVFRNNKLYTGGFKYHYMNMFSVDDNYIESNNVIAKGFYLYDSNERKNNDSVIMKKQEIRNSLVYSNKIPNYYDIFKDRFNVSFSFSRSYEENINNALKYIMYYNSGLMNKFYEKIDKTVSRVYTGKELKDMSKNGYVKMSRRVHNTMNNYVMIFCNGEIYDKYNELEYVNKDFVFPVNTLKDTDTVEILFFLKVYNETYPIVLASKREDNYLISPTIDMDYCMLFTPQPEELDFHVEISPHKQYEVDFEYKDNENGTYMIYPKNPFYYDKRLNMASERQFRYFYTKINYDALDIILPSDDFKFCTNRDQYLVFINGKKLPRDNFKVVTPDPRSPFDDYSIYSNIPFKKNDRIEVFYIPDKMNEIVYEQNIRADGNIYVDKSKLKHNVSKNLNFIFVNGKKIPKSSLYDVDQNLIKITTNIKSVHNLCITQHVETDALLYAIFSHTKDTLTSIIDSLSSVEFNKLFYNTNITANEADMSKNEIDMKNVIYSIVQDYFASPFINTGKDFMYGDLDGYFESIFEQDSEKTKLVDRFDATLANKPRRGIGGIDDYKDI